MNTVALARFLTGSCGATTAASRKRFRRCSCVSRPPIGSERTKPADALAPTMTIRLHGDFAVEDDSAAVAAGRADSCALLTIVPFQNGSSKIVPTTSNDFRV